MTAMTRGLWLTPVLVLVLNSIVACSAEPLDPSSAATGSQVDGHAAEKHLRIGITQYPSTFHPNIENMSAKTYVLGMAMRPLSVVDADWELQCGFCVQAPTLENGLARLEQTPDGKPGIALTFTLPDNARWGDGANLTSRDVLFTWEVGHDPRVGTNGQELYRSIYAIDLIDERTFVMHRDRRTYNYNQFVGFYILPEHIERPVYEANPTEYRNRTTYDANPATPGLYYGPYLVTETARGSHITLEQNPYWNGPRPYFERITVRIIERTTTLEANLLSGNIDMIAGELGMRLNQALVFEKRHGEEFNILFKPGLEYEHIDLNLDNPILADQRVRQALLYALDRDTVNQQLFAGKQPVAASSVNPLDRQHTHDVHHYPFDPDRAAALLDAAGWLRQGNEVRRNGAGEPLLVELMTTAGDRTRELIEQVFQSQWKDVGIDTRIRNQTPRVFFGDTTRRRKYSGMAMFAWISAPEATPRAVLHSSQIPTAENNFAGSNYMGYNNPEMDAAIDAMENELDPERRLVHWRRIQQIYAEELPVLPLYFRASPYILPKWLEGVQPTGHVQHTTLWIEHWRRAG